MQPCPPNTRITRDVAIAAIVACASAFALGCGSAPKQPVPREDLAKLSSELVRQGEPERHVTVPANFDRSLIENPSKELNFCSASMGSKNEEEAFRKAYVDRMDSKWHHVDLLELPAKAGVDKQDWFEFACAAGVRCDVLFVSGEFAGSHFWGEGNQRVSMDQLEKQACRDGCLGLLNDPVQVSLFGCNTLADKSGDSRTPGQYEQILRDHPERPAPPFAVEAEVALRYCAGFGISTRQRMQRIFKKVPIIDGFNGSGPKGSTIDADIKEYFRKIPDYAAFIEKARVQTKVVDNLAALNKPANPLMQQALRDTNYASCAGNRIDDDPVFQERVCVMRDKEVPLDKKVDQVGAMLSDEGRLGKYLPVIMEFFTANPPPYPTNPAATAALGRLRANPTAVKTFLSKVRELKMANLMRTLAELGGKVGILTDAERNQIETESVVIGLEDPDVRTVRSTLTSIQLTAPAGGDLGPALQTAWTTIMKAPGSENSQGAQFAYLQAAGSGIPADNRIIERVQADFAKLSRENREIAVRTLAKNYGAHASYRALLLTSLRSADGDLASAALSAVAGHRLASPEIKVEVLKLRQRSEAYMRDRAQRALEIVFGEAPAPEPARAPAQGRRVREL